MTAAILALVVGAAFSLAASIVLVTRIERLGERLGLTEAMLGLVAALAADAPEITSAAAALARGQHAVGVGVVLGSNVFNLAALLGLGALVAGRIALHRRVVALEGAVGLWMAAVSICALAGLIGAPAGLVLVLLALLPYAWLSALRPSLCVIEVGARNRYGHPDPGTLARLEDARCGVWRTDRDGDVDVSTDGRQVTVRARGRDTTLVLCEEQPCGHR